MRPLSPPASDLDDIVFAEESLEPAPSATEPWKVLIVDDEPDVHDTTELALRGLEVLGRPLQFLHARSAAQARACIDAEPELAVVLLDVVMETPDAGLELVRYIREEARRGCLRIVLRTGQPGYAPEMDTIRLYDINDYKTKTELTRTRLFTTLMVAIRSYQQLRQVEATRQGLESIISASMDLSRLRGLKSFAEGVVIQLCALLGVQNEGLVCALSTSERFDPLVVAASRRYADMIGQPLSHCAPAHQEVITLLHATLRERRSTAGKALGLYFPVSSMAGMAAYIDVPGSLSEVDQRLIEVFVANITAGFDNVLLNERMTRLAYSESLLGLPNRNALIDWLDEGSTSDAVVAQIDLDGFADINSTLDQHFGDLVLKAVAARLAQCFPAPTRLAYLSVDVFGLLGLPQRITPAAIAQVFAEPFVIEGQMLRLSATSGLLHVPAGARGIGHDAITKSSIAVKQAKTRARGQALHYDVSQSELVRERMRLLNELRSALSSNRLFLVYQPVVDLRSGVIVGAEALLRCRAESGELIPPGRFIPLAEQSGMMVPIGAWVVRSALGELRRLIDLGHTGFRMAINVSHAQFREPDFVMQFARTMAECRVPATNIELELTESVAVENTQALIEKLNQVRALGATVAIDDFGTGYSALSILRQLPLNRIKIDRSFVSMIDKDASFARLIVTMGRQLGLTTIAEGIESVLQLGALQAMHCEEGQGYLFSQPVPARELQQLLASGKPLL